MVRPFGTPEPDWLIPLGAGWRMHEGECVRQPGKRRDASPDPRWLEQAPSRATLPRRRGALSTIMWDRTASAERDGYLSSVVRRLSAQARFVPRRPISRWSLSRSRLKEF